MRYTYPAIIHREDGGFWAEFPDFPGCFSQGDSIDEIIGNCQEALEGHIASFLDDEQPLPASSDILSLVVDDNCFCNYISCIVRREDSIKKTLTIPRWLNRQAEAYHINFSQTLQEALKAKIAMIQ